MPTSEKTPLLSKADAMEAVYVVDDDPAVRHLSTLILKLDGYDVTPFGSPSSALRQLKDAAVTMPAAIILDLNMPEMDGREFYSRARELGYRGPVVILSAYGAAAAQQELGAQAAIEKPFAPDALSATLKAVLTHI